MKKKLMIIAVCIASLVLFTGVFFLIFGVFADMRNDGKGGSEQEEKENRVVDITSFSAYTEQAEFQKVPAMATEGAKIGEARKCGSTYVIDVNGTTEADYDAYLAILEKKGFTKHSENGEDKMEGYVKTASFIGEDITLTVTQMLSWDKTYISVTRDLALSDHMIYEDYAEENTEGAQTKLYMMELVAGIGNSFVIQLKNGHFVLYDGGKEEEMLYLLDFLESLAPEGEKPVIEAWFISHAHVDHNGVLLALAEDAKNAGRLIVDGIYYQEPAEEVVRETGESISPVRNTVMAHQYFKDQKGNTTAFYRPQLGQRYYFSDIYIDVCMTPDVYLLDTYYQKDFNDTSIWLKAFIEGQTFLCGGDSGYTGTRTIMNTFDRSYCDVDIFAVLHHGINVYNYFTDFVQADTALYTSWRTLSPFHEHTEYLVSRIEENEHLKESVKECFSYGDGTVVLTFPYTVGAAKILPKNQWIYGDVPFRKGLD